MVFGIATNLNRIVEVVLFIIYSCNQSAHLCIGHAALYLRPILSVDDVSLQPFRVLPDALGGDGLADAFIGDDDGEDGEGDEAYDEEKQHQEI